MRQIQSLADKRLHIRALLPLCEDHLFYFPHMELVRDYGIPDAGDPGPPPPPPNPNKDLAWVEHQRYLRRLYRITAVEHSLAWLNRETPIIGQCVYYHWVNPWPAFMEKTRHRFADIGLTMMAIEIPGDVHSPIESRAETLTREVMHMLEKGWSQRRICRTLHCRPEVVVRIRTLHPSQVGHKYGQTCPQVVP